MKRILWVSKNSPPLDSQVAELRRLFGDDLMLHVDNKPFSSAHDIIRRFERGLYDEMVLIAPLSVCRIMTEEGYKPLYSEMIQDSTNYELEIQGNNRNTRKYRFIRFKRLEAINMVFSDILAIDKTN